MFLDTICFRTPLFFTEIIIFSVRKQRVITVIGKALDALSEVLEFELHGRGKLSPCLISSVVCRYKNSYIKTNANDIQYVYIHVKVQKPIS